MTVGYRHLCDPKHPPITEKEGEAFLRQDLRTALDATLRYCPVLATEPESRLAAIVDFTFNLSAGAAADLDPAVEGQPTGLGRRSLRTTSLGLYGGSKVLPGLVSHAAKPSAPT
ncbi:MAG: glycoside hydrolase family protein [Pseudomonadota bacterium]